MNCKEYIRKRRGLSEVVPGIYLDGPMENIKTLISVETWTKDLSKTKQEGQPRELLHPFVMFAQSNGLVVPR